MSVRMMAPIKHEAVILFRVVVAFVVQCSLFRNSSRRLIVYSYAYSRALSFAARLLIYDNSVESMLPAKSHHEANSAQMSTAEPSGAMSFENVTDKANIALASGRMAW